MNTRRMAATRLEEDRMKKEVSPQVEQGPKDGQGYQVLPQGYHIFNVEGSNEVSVVHRDLNY